MAQNGEVTFPQDNDENPHRGREADNPGRAPAGQRGRFRRPRPPAIVPGANDGPAHNGVGEAGGVGHGVEKAGEPQQSDNHSAGSTAKAEPTQAAGEAQAASGASSVGVVEAKRSTGPSAHNDDADNESGKNATDEVVRAGGSMAIATLLSRITGFLRTVLIGSALGPAIASAFNTANTLPHLITELVLGAVLTSLVVPVLVRAEKEDPDGGEAFIRRLMTLTFTLMGAVTVLSILAAPFLVEVGLDENGHVNIDIATSIAYLVLPQIVCFAMFAVFMAVLNTKGMFKPGAWAPVVNNLVTLGILVLYYMLPDETKLNPNESVTITNPHILLLGLGTTLGVVAQAAIMIPFLRKAGINMKPLWGVDKRLKAFGGMAIAIIVYVAISQAGWMLNNRIASQASDAAVTVYMQAWQLLQMPYGVIGVTLLTAIMPRLSRNAADGDDRAVVRDLTSATKLTLLALLPVIVFFTGFGTLVSAALFQYQNFDLETANVLGWTISFSAFTLIPYALVMLHLRVFYAREEVWTPTYIIAGITTTKLALAFLAPHISTEPRLVVVLLGAANGFGFLTGSIIGALLLRRSLGSLQGRDVVKTALWTVGASLVGALIAWRVDVLLATYVFQTPANPWFLIRMLIVGPIFLIVTGLVLSRSKLPEVDMFGLMLARMPVVGRFFTPRRPVDADRAAAIAKPDSADQAQMAMQETGVLGDYAGTFMPPMSAGRVRGPRLVPGAPMLQGQYRLLADHGGSPATRLWQAREMSTGNIVALTIMDPAAYVKNAVKADDTHTTKMVRVARAKDDMLRRSATLKDIDCKGMATVRRVIDNGNLVVIVSDWLQGSPLSTVAQSGPDPMAAGYAVAALADAADDAHKAGIPLGIDHRDRLRITTAGHALLAFPGVLPNNTERQDAHGITVALGLLLEHLPDEEIPEELVETYRELKAINTDPDKEVDLHKVANHLRKLTSGDLDVEEDDVPEPTKVAGFGAEPARAPRLALIAFVTFLIVALLAAAIAGVVSVVGGDRNDSPLSTNSIRQGAGRLGDKTPRPVPVANVVAWAPADAEVKKPGDSGNPAYGPDNPDRAHFVIDGDPNTVWSTESYLNQLGSQPPAFKQGTGVLLEMPAETRFSELDLSGLTPGAHLEVRIAGDSADSLAQTQVLTGFDVKQPHTIIRLDDSQRRGAGESATAQSSAAQPGNASSNAGRSGRATSGARDGVPPGADVIDLPKNADTEGTKLIIWVTKVAEPKNTASIGEIDVLGTWRGMPETEEPAKAPAR